MKRSLNHLIWKLNPKEQEVYNTVLVGLLSMGYISLDDDGEFVRLTAKGYDYIYDESLVKKMNNIPWVIPEYNNVNWTRAWNKLWSVIGDKLNNPYYLSGPFFLNMICRLDDSIESNYSRYIENRRNKGLSTSRSEYFRDLIDGLDKELRFQLYVKIQLSFEDKILKVECESENSVSIPVSLESKRENDETIAISLGDDKRSDENMDVVDSAEHPKVFISYSWDSEEHKKWVLNLASKLRENGVDVILDQWDLQKGGSLIPNFMQQSVMNADRVLCILTQNYKEKTDNLNGGVGCEYSILSADIASNLTTNKFIPILRQGDSATSIPIILKGRFRYDMQDDAKFNETFNSLLRDLYNIPVNPKPALGNKPDFSKLDN